MERYFALLDGESGAFGVAFPDCPGCTATGSDENEAYANTIAALGEWIHDAHTDGAARDQGVAQRSGCCARRSPKGRSFSRFLSSRGRMMVTHAIVRARIDVRTGYQATEANFSRSAVMAVLVTAIHAAPLQTTIEVGDGGRAWMAVTSTAMTVGTFRRSA